MSTQHALTVKNNLHVNVYYENINHGFINSYSITPERKLYFHVPVNSHVMHICLFRCLSVPDSPGHQG